MPQRYHGPERRLNVRFSDEQYAEIADRVATIFEERALLAIGRWTVRRFLLLCGAASGAAYVLGKLLVFALDKGLI